MSSPMMRFANMKQRGKSSSPPPSPVTYASFFGPNAIDPRLLNSATTSSMSATSPAVGPISTPQNKAPQNNASRRKSAPISRLVTPRARTSARSSKTSTKKSFRGRAPDTDLLLALGPRNTRASTMASKPGPKRMPINYAESDTLPESVESETEYEVDVNEDGTVTNVRKQKRQISPDSSTEQQTGEKKPKTLTEPSTPLAPRPVTSDLDSDDEMMMKLHKRGLSSGQISKIFQDQGREYNKPKSISSRTRRIENHLHNKLEKQADTAEQEFDDHDIKVLVKAVDKVDNWIDSEIQKLFRKKWFMAVKEVRAATPGKVFSEGGCEAAYLQWEKAQHRATRKARTSVKKLENATSNDSNTKAEPQEGDFLSSSEHDNTSDDSDYEDLDEATRAFRRHTINHPKQKTKPHQKQLVELTPEVPSEATIRDTSAFLTAAMSSWKAKPASTGIVYQPPFVVANENADNAFTPAGYNDAPFIPGINFHNTHQTLEASTAAFASNLPQTSALSRETFGQIQGPSAIGASREDVGDEDKMSSDDLFVDQGKYQSMSAGGEPGQDNMTGPSFSSVPLTGQAVSSVAQDGKAASQNRTVFNHTTARGIGAGFPKLPVSMANLDGDDDEDDDFFPTAVPIKNGTAMSHVPAIAERYTVGGLRPMREEFPSYKYDRNEDLYKNDCEEILSFTKPNRGPNANTPSATYSKYTVPTVNRDKEWEARVYNALRYKPPPPKKSTTAIKQSTGIATTGRGSEVPCTPANNTTNETPRTFTPINIGWSGADVAMAQADDIDTSPSIRPASRRASAQDFSASSSSYLPGSAQTTVNATSGIGLPGAPKNGSSSTTGTTLRRPDSPSRGPRLPNPASPFYPNPATLDPVATAHRALLPAPPCDSIPEYSRKLHIVNVEGSHIPQPCAAGRRVRLSNVPPFATAIDIRKLFSDFKLAGFTRDGCLGNTWYVDCQDANSATRACVGLSNKTFTNFHNEEFPLWELDCAVYRHPLMMFRHGFRSDYPVVSQAPRRF